MQIFMVPIHALTIWEKFPVSAGEQEFSPPVSVMVESSLYNKFPGIRNVQWKKNHSYYSTSFALGNAIFSALFSLDGRLLMHKKEITETDLPEVILHKVRKEFGDYVIKKVEKMEQDNIIYFYITIQDSQNERFEIFSADGESSQTLMFKAREIQTR